MDFSLLQRRGYPLKEISGLFSFFFPKKIAETNSPINGKIEVIEQFGKKSIRVQNLEQSGPMVEKIWETGVKEITKALHFCLLRGGPATRGLLGGGDLQKRKASTVANILILGLGAGSVVKIINKHFPQARILGVEIDPVMIKLGKKCFGLSEYQNLKIKIGDAFDWLKEVCLNDSNLPDGKAGHLNKYNLILVDIYIGKKGPLEVEGEEFLKNLKRLLTTKGIVIFNRLRGKKEDAKFQLLLDKLKKMYHHIKVIKPVANYLIICS